MGRAGTIRSLFTTVSRWGVTPEMPPAFAKRIIVTNLLGMLFFFNMSMSATGFFVLGEYALASFTTFFVLTEISWPYLNKLGYHNLSRLGLMISSNLLGFLVSVMLPGTGYNRGFFVMAGIPVLLFELRERGYMLLGLALTLLLYPLSEWAQYQNPYAADFTPAVQQGIRYVMGIIYVVLIFFMFLFLSRESDRAGHRLEEQRVRAFSAAKFAALGELAGGIAHEINNPMTVIRLQARMLERDLGAAELDRTAVRQHLDDVLGTIRRVASIVDNMRVFSRDGDRDESLVEPLEPIVADTVSFCLERFRSRQIELRVSIPEGQATEVHCRSVQISQVLLNLLNNAYDAVEPLPERWVRLEVSATPAARQALIAVTDSGRGIRPDERERIFRPFFTTKPPGKGTGLGLSLSRKMIEDHGGTLTIDESSPHTRFVIRLPLAPQGGHA